MLTDSLLLPAVFKYAEDFPADSVRVSIELKNEPISAKNKTDSWGFILFLVCFFIFAYVVSQRAKLLYSMASGLFHNKDRQSIFFETMDHEFSKKLLLAFQTVILASIIIYRQAAHEKVFSAESPSLLFIFTGITALTLIVFIGYKFLVYSFIGRIFFNKETGRQWHNNFFSLICLSGNMLFFPTLILFYVDKAYYFCMYFILFYLFFILIVAFYKIFTIFFQEKSLLLYFILYLCTLEILPLFLVYRGFIYLFLIVQKDTLWIQI
ncbi:hypothetical protein FACS189420_6480 [Bacteroidia bacterium]|nr:hypothetical protein FACS189420_6480 [Bacteroidia bacterium]